MLDRYLLNNMFFIMHISVTSYIVMLYINLFIISYGLKFDVNKINIDIPIKDIPSIIELIVFF